MNKFDEMHAAITDVLSDERIRELATRMVGDYFAETMSMGQCVERSIRLAVAETAEACKAELAAANEATGKLRAEVERLREDAKRYRWLRDAKASSAPAGSLAELWLFSRPTASATAFDVAIDAAIDAARKG